MPTSLNPRGATSQEPLIVAEHVGYQYPASTGPSLHDINLRIHSGARVLVVGQNGSGKSTLLSLLGGRRKPGTGTIRVLGQDPFDCTSLGADIALMGAPWPAEAYFANTVDRVASPAPYPERKAAVAELLHLRLSRGVDKMSSGEKRRTQILHSMLLPATIYLLDEFSTDIDLAERATVLDLVRKECDLRGGCCLYATHILDRTHDWATHLLLVKGGRIVAFLPISAITVSLEVFALQFISQKKARASFRISHVDPSSPDMSDGCWNPLGKRGSPEAVVTCCNLTYKDVFFSMSFTIYRGERVLLCGCNGSGKSTLLNMLGGKQFFPNSNGALCILGKVCYDDMTLNASIAYGGDWWVTVPGGEVRVKEMMTLTTARAHHLRELLAVDMEWDVRHISAGEQKRVQLLLFLLEDKPIIFLDEATADLDIDQRHALLHFLHSESVSRGVTIMYSTHIFGGLDGWADTVLLLDRTKRGVHAVWREREGVTIDLNQLAAEMAMLKKLEVF